MRFFLLFFISITAVAHTNEAPPPIRKMLSYISAWADLPDHPSTQATFEYSIKATPTIKPTMTVMSRLMERVGAGQFSIPSFRSPSEVDAVTIFIDNFFAWNSKYVFLPTYADSNGQFVLVGGFAQTSDGAGPWSSDRLVVIGLPIQRIDQLAIGEFGLPALATLYNLYTQLPNAPQRAQIGLASLPYLTSMLADWKSCVAAPIPTGLLSLPIGKVNEMVMTRQCGYIPDFALLQNVGLFDYAKQVEELAAESGLTNLIRPEIRKNDSDNVATYGLLRAGNGQVTHLLAVLQMSAENAPKLDQALPKVYQNLRYPTRIVRDFWPGLDCAQLLGKRPN